MRSSVTRMHVGGFLAPESYGPNERLVVNAWLVRHPEATILVDTGIAEHIPPADVAELKFVRLSITDALAGLGVGPDKIEVVINSHLHADHAGGNVHFPQARILAQPAELVAAREPDYSVSQDLNLDEGRYEERAGDYEVLPGIRVLLTPGHSPGHQSVMVETDAGRLLLAGQSYRDASGFARAVTALELARAGHTDVPDTPDWLPQLLALQPARVAFGHDRAVWAADA
ncbi:MAG: N-acyl homoserine lactonase family protein [Candidatus Limnocylindria bacterium]